MIETYINGVWQNQPDLIGALQLNEEIHPVISIVGGGGKTTTCRRLMEDFEMHGQTPIVTTTTHMQKEEGGYFYGEENLDGLKSVLERKKKVWMGAACGETMMKSLSIDFLNEAVELPVPFIVEADGAKRMPCKIPDQKEPVVLKETTTILAVYGMDAVMKPLKEGCFRLELVKQFLGKSEEDLLLPEDVAKIAASEKGGKKCWIPDMAYHVILNKTDDPIRKQYTDQIARLLAKQQIPVTRTSFLLKPERLGGRFS